jgi:hypothetical protein
MFNEIWATGGGTGFGPAPIPVAQIFAWSQLKRRRISPWESDMIRLLDQTYLRVPAQTAPLV